MTYFLLVFPVNADSKSKYDKYFSDLTKGLELELLNETEEEELVYTLTRDDPEDFYLLGNIYQTGNAPNERKVKKNLKEAIKWWKKATFKGHDLAQYELGQTYMRGVGVLKDKILAHMWFNIAAWNGMETAAGIRDYLEEQMSHSDIKLATKRAKKCLSSNFKRCSF